MASEGPNQVGEMTFDRAMARAQEIAVQLLDADMTDPANVAMREEAFAMLRAFSDRSEALYTHACSAVVAIRRQARAAANDTTVGPVMTEKTGPTRIVILDPDRIRSELGREPTPDESDAIALHMDAEACGRSITMTVAACEVFGGHVSAETRRILGVY
ncbi:MAG: hypothetical protein AAB592_01855 [Patescibacteria group bacterium]